MRKILVIGWLLAAQLASAGAAFAVETDVDRLLEFLIKEKVLTQEKATEFRADLAIKKQEEKQPAAVPDWVQNVKLKGDVRTRYEWTKNKGQEDNVRARIRARVGIEGKVNSKVKAGIGISTGTTSDPRSRDITLGASSNYPGAPKGIILDYAYGEYTPFQWLTLTAGKFKNNLWQPFDTFWDNDLTPEGVGFNLSHKLNSKSDLFLNDLFFILKNDSRTDNRPFVNALQSGLNYAINGNTKVKGAFTYYRFNGIKDAVKFSDSKSHSTAISSPYPTGGNTLLANNTYKYNYDAIQPSVEIFFKDPLNGLVPYASLFGDYIYNVSNSHPTGRGGYDIGLKFGDEKVGDWSKWQAKLVYSKLGRDSWLDILTDNNRYGGDTNSKAFEAILEYGLGKNTSLVFDYYYAKSLDKTNSGNPEQLFQADWNLKF